jgi:protein gp37
MSKSKIQWTDATWNPTRGCTRVSPGCENCYAERQAIRHVHSGYADLVRYNHIDGSPRWTGKIRLVPEKLDEPLRWRKPRMVFVDSMSDLFHEDVPDRFIEEAFSVMALAHQHTFQVLTKRPDRMAAFLNDREGKYHWSMIEGGAQRRHHERTGEDPSEWLAVHGPLPNVWLGVSVENQKYADERIRLLLKTPAAVRFVSCEPLLGPVDLSLHLKAEEASAMAFFNSRAWHRALHWIIVGGESGPGARPCSIEWIRSIVRKCKESGTPCFVKQVGANPSLKLSPYSDQLFHGLVRDRKGGDPMEWPPDLRVRQWPQ